MTTPKSYEELIDALLDATKRVWCESASAKGYVTLFVHRGFSTLFITNASETTRTHIVQSLRCYDIRPTNPKTVIDEIGEYLTSDGRKAFVRLVYKYDCIARIEGETQEGSWNIDGTYDGVPCNSGNRTKIIEKVKGYGPK